ncbi:bifunctional diaminohydroxyphosphoribosylaminopyrimidine deaminase/5-amino-6-(5-phosphoribosylamino)uracil reductase RibD [Methylopila turkensis]|nr:bifunctional diaminohydroxyphosphoribosylaminopyrimidine deaminase/5-amino-6-(5-phosphoribosylamino)uracil reductase RibD [Methylopila turkensis]
MERAVASSEDARWMEVAVALGRRGLGRTAPNPPVGAVLVAPGLSGGFVVGRGWTQPGGRPHAESRALAWAGEAARGATLYVTLEPCSHYGRTPPCADGLIEAGVARVVAAMADPDPRVNGRGIARLRESGVLVSVGVGAADAARLNAGHVARVALGRPHVTLKLAVSPDGKAGLAGRRPVAITGEMVRARVHMMRAEADAIMVGVGTVLADDPSLTCRLPGLEDRSPARVVLDADLRTPLRARIVRTAREVPTWIVTGEDAPADAERRLAEAGVQVMRVERCPGGRPELLPALKLLAMRGVTRLMVEGGPILAGALLRADVVDAATVLTGPVPLGEDAIDAVDGLPLTAITEGPRFRGVARERIGDDIWADYERA